MNSHNKTFKTLISALFIILLLFTPFALFAENLDSLFDEDSSSNELSLFENEDSLYFTDDLYSEENENIVNDDSKDLFNSLLGEDTQAIEITGSYSFSLEGGFRYTFNQNDNLSYFLNAPLDATFSLSARPTTDTRFFMKSNISYPFDDSGSISIKELFGDFIVADDYFFRVGKQTLNWGVGYFFSPANLLNLTPIDPFNPEEELEGPLAVKINHPVGVDNLYAYVIVPNSDDLVPTDLVYAFKGEKVLGKMEVSLGGRYSYNETSATPALMATVSAPVSPLINVFAEAVESYDDKFNFEGTIGFSFMKNLEKISDVSLTLSAQYYYNQDGVVPYYYNGLFRNFDKTHQLGGVISLSLPNNLSISLASINVLSELSGVLSPKVCYNVSDGISICMGLNYYYGELMTFGSNSSIIEPSIKITLGGGDF